MRALIFERNGEPNAMLTLPELSQAIPRASFVTGGDALSPQSKYQRLGCSPSQIGLHHPPVCIPQVLPRFLRLHGSRLEHENARDDLQAIGDAVLHLLKQHGAEDDDGGPQENWEIEVERIVKALQGERKPGIFSVKGGAAGVAPQSVFRRGAPSSPSFRVLKRTTAPGTRLRALIWLRPVPVST